MVEPVPERPPVPPAPGTLTPGGRVIHVDSGGTSPLAALAVASGPNLGFTGQATDKSGGHGGRQGLDCPRGRRNFGCSLNPEYEGMPALPFFLAVFPFDFLAAFLWPSPEYPRC